MALLCPNLNHALQLACVIVVEFSVLEYSYNAVNMLSVKTDIFGLLTRYYNISKMITTCGFCY